ncbi:MAG: hypothetical protein EZS26_001299 [Candidatus Ordinivivax streblomastigis]|uniref:Uncharacterized protein n=1 Tax=Candidatus Ordinivivax streblomastigis TaxID=2540710 RepID=A0A5M8P1Z0_9BACT|nr:MAG: hypothetical protein EZS26_001299 [Candidatus Ordinivivax streblomastigis]
MNKILIYTICLFCYINIFAQGRIYPGKTEYDIQRIDELIIVNENLYPVLDSIISMKSMVTYFKNGSLFTMWFGLDSIKLDLIIIHAEGKHISGSNHDLGLFDYKQNTFFVRGDTLDTTIFAKTKKQRKIDFSVTPSFVKKNGKIVFDMYADERYCMWLCRYENNKFNLLSFRSFDKNVPSSAQPTSF